MARLIQPWLPEIRRVKKLKKIRKTPKPQVGEFAGIKKFELQYHPFDLMFRGRLHNWLRQIKEDKKINPRLLLDYQQARIVQLYLFPQKPDGVWLTQKQVSEKLKKTLTRKFRKQLVGSLMILWEKTR